MAIFGILFSRCLKVFVSVRVQLRKQNDSYVFLALQI